MLNNFCSQLAEPSGNSAKFCKFIFFLSVLIYFYYHLYRVWADKYGR